MKVWPLLRAGVLLAVASCKPSSSSSSSPPSPSAGVPASPFGEGAQPFGAGIGPSEEALNCEERKAEVDRLALELQQALDAPDPDAEVETTRRVDLVMALGALHHEAAVDVLRAVLREPADAQAVAVHRAAADALGEIGSGRAVGDLLAVLWRVPDAPTTTSLAERVKLALIATGDPARGSVLRAFRGEHEAVNALAAAQGIDPQYVAMTAAGVLAWLGPASTVALSHALDDACPEPHDPENSMLVANLANSLGLIGDERAVPSLCRCLAGSTNPGEAYPLAEALGNIGGTQAHACLRRTVRTARYDLDTVATPEYEFELRWEAGRFAVMTATPADVVALRKLFAGRKEPVRKQLAAWEPGLSLLERCEDARPCYEEALADDAAPWFAREVAAMHLARAAPGDTGVAVAISRAASVRNPDARATMTWLPSRVLRSSRCAPCTEALDRQEDRDREAGLPRTYQLSVLRSRYTRAALRPLKPPRCWAR